ncbi:Phosphoglycolate phosphatase [Carnimonas sp. R-84981]|uniref:phosphoglycolate phosphatase n=1 Tax=Carnimonas bestiolae TaxID=3402172 RepID=UPI003EDBF96A
MHPALAHTRLVICDLDGTLVDSIPDLAAALDSALSDSGYSAAGLHKARGWVGNGTEMLVKRALADAHGIAEQQVNESELKQVLERFNRAYAQSPCCYSQLYPGVMRFLERLKQTHVTMALVTNKPCEFVDPVLKGTGIGDYFSLVLGGDSLPHKKPDPEPLLHVLKHFDIAAANALMVGDSRNDVRAGKAAQVATLAVSYGYNHGEPIAHSEPDWIVDALTEVLDD